MNEPIWRRFLRLRGADPRADVRDEFAFHLEERTEALMAAGLPEAEARARARERFGDVVRATETCAGIAARRVRRVHWLETLESIAQDFRHAAQGIRRAPGFALTAVLTIALGIGGNTAVFSVLNALLFQPLDAQAPHELVRVYTSEGRELRTDSDRYGGSSYADYTDLARSRQLAGLAASMPIGTTIELGNRSVRPEARVVSENYFDVIGRPPLLGGWRGGSDANRGIEAIVSHEFWKRRLGGDSTIVGRSLRVNERLVVIAGVTAPAFRGIELSVVDLYLPFTSARELTGRAGILTDRGERSIRMLGRLAPGATAEAAERDLGAIMRRIAAEAPATNASRVMSVRRATSIVPMELAGNAVLPVAGLVFGATLVMLAIAGVNVAAVLLARTMRRRREMAVRASLGAGPLRLVRQLASETILLALIATSLVVLVLWQLPLLSAQLGIPRSLQPGVDARVLAYAIVLALGSGVLFALAPALVTIRSDVVTALRAGDADSRPRARAQRVLVAAQLALSMVLLIVGGALLRSLERQRQVDPGFDPARLIVADFEHPSGQFDRAHAATLAHIAVERAAAIPGVAAVSVTSMAPLTSDGATSTIRIPGYTEAGNENIDVPMITGGPELFATLDVPMRRGRELSWSHADTLERVIVNESMARRYWGARDPVGTFIELGGAGGRSAEVIAVSADARFRSLDEAPRPMFAIQRADGGGSALLIRTAGEPGRVLGSIRSVLSRSDLPLTLMRIRTMEDILESSLSVTRAITVTLAVVGALAALLAAVGLYGVVAYITSGRAREIGVRLALGATRRSISRLVLGYGLRLTLIGGLLGTVGGLAAVQAMGGMLFESAGALALVSAVWLVLCAMTLAACAVPSWRAMQIAPASALRAD